MKNTMRSIPGLALLGAVAFAADLHAQGTWVERSSATTPPAATLAGMTYDALRERTIALISGETWSWNGTDWTCLLYTSG